MRSGGARCASSTEHASDDQRAAGVALVPFGDFCAYGGDDRVRFLGGVLVVREHVGGIADEQAVVAPPRR